MSECLKVFIWDERNVPQLDGHYGAGLVMAVAENIEQARQFALDSIRKQIYENALNGVKWDNDRPNVKPNSYAAYQKYYANTTKKREALASEKAEAERRADNELKHRAELISADPIVREFPFALWKEAVN